MTGEEVLRVLRQHLTDDQVRLIEPHLVPAIRLDATRIADTELRAGQSRFSGSPDLPKHFIWPVNQGRVLQFLGQLNLSELSSFEAASVLPDHGWLYFFYDLLDQPWGYDPRDRGAWAVRYCDESDAAGLVRTSMPPMSAQDKTHEFADWPKSFHVCELSPKPAATLPDLDEFFRKLNIRVGDEVMEKFCDQLFPDGGAKHQVLGEPHQIQGGMELMCQLVSHGLYCGDATGYGDPRAAQLERGASDWQLLFQIDTDEERPGWMWGDCGSLYYWIHKKDLKARDFDHTWLCLQCY